MKKTILIIAIIVLAILLAGNKPKISGYGYDSCNTLWDLAERHCPAEIDKRDFVEEVKKLNAMPDYKVFAGREYQYPIYEVEK